MFLCVKTAVNAIYILLNTCSFMARQLQSLLERIECGRLYWAIRSA